MPHRPLQHILLAKAAVKLQHMLKALLGSLQQAYNRNSFMVDNVTDSLVMI